MPTLDHKLYLAPPSGGTFVLIPLANFSLTVDPTSQLADRLDFACRIDFDDSSAPAATAGRIPGDTRFDDGARVELWAETGGSSRRLFKGVVTAAPERDGWKLKFTAHNDLWRLNKAIAEFSSEATVAATYTPGYLSQAADLPDGTLELSPTLGSPPQSGAYGTRGRRAWKSGAFVLESNYSGSWKEIPANTFQVTPRLGLLSVGVAFQGGAQYRLKSVSVYQEGTNEVEDNIETALTYAESSGGAGFSAGNLDLEETDVTISTLVQLPSSGYISDLIADLTGPRYAAGYRLFAQYDYTGVSLGDPVKVLGRNVYQDVPPPRTVSGTVKLDQPTSVEEIAKRVVSTVTLLEPGNLATDATITNHLTSGSGWANVYPLSGVPGVLIDGSTAQQFARYKETEQGDFVPFVSLSLSASTLIGRVLITAGQAKVQRSTAYTIYGSNDVTLPIPGAAGWEIIPGCYQVAVKTAQLGGGIIQPGSTVDVSVEDPRAYRHILVECKTYKWGRSSLEGTAGAIEIQVFGRRVKEFQALLQNTDVWGGQAVSYETSLTGTATFTDGSDTVNVSGGSLTTEIADREIDDGIAVKLDAKDKWLRVIDVVSETQLKIAARCPAAEAGVGAISKKPFLNTYKPTLLAALASLGPMVFIDDDGIEESPAGAHLRAYEVLDEKSRFYQGVSAEFAPDEYFDPFETVKISDTDHNAGGIPILVERITQTEKTISIEGVNYRGN